MALVCLKAAISKAENVEIYLKAGGVGSVKLRLSVHVCVRAFLRSVCQIM